MARKLAWMCVTFLFAISSFAIAKRTIPWGPDNPKPPVADAKWDEDLGSGVLGQLAYAIEQGRGMELAKEWGFEPDREIKVSSITDLGEFARYAPPGIKKMGWSGTAYIRGLFEEDVGHPAFNAGILVYKLDNGPVIWIHATEAWLDWIDHPGPWIIRGHEKLAGQNVGEEIRAVVSMNLNHGDDMMVNGIGSWGIEGTVGNVKLRLVHPFQENNRYSLNRYDIWLKRSRVAVLQKDN